jgi:CheY-like chemotaxis protein
MPMILVVDDHRDTCRLLTRLLRQLGFEAECVLSGAEAIDVVAGAAAHSVPLAEAGADDDADADGDGVDDKHNDDPARGAQRPRLVLLDIMMPGMDGFETLRRLRDLPAARQLPIVMLSALSDDEHRERARQLGATDYWVKGTFEPALLGQMLSTHLPPADAPTPPPPSPESD